MAAKKDPDEGTSALAAELADLRREVRRLNGHRWVRVQNSTWRLMLQSLLRGLAIGLGTVIGASALVSVLVFFLSRIDFLPIVGEWAADLATQIEAEVSGRREGQ